MVKDIGIKTSTPKKECGDRNCPFHGALRLRGREFTGEVASSRAQKTAIIVWKRRSYVPKYERYEKRITRIKAQRKGIL